MRMHHGAVPRMLQGSRHLCRAAMAAGRCTAGGLAHILSPEQDSEHATATDECHIDSKKLHASNMEQPPGSLGAKAP